MFNVVKASEISSGSVSAEELELINRQTLKPLTADEVYVFRVNACNDQPDRDDERFPVESLQKMAELFVGKPVLFDHAWSAKMQTARIFDGCVKQQSDGSNALQLSCYMIRNERTADVIASIDGGILREVSVGLRVKTVKCNICGQNARVCEHIRGHMYDNVKCIYELCDPEDGFELSFVAVPAQPDAGVTKAAERKQGWTPAELAAEKARIYYETERTKYYEQIC